VFIILQRSEELRLHNLVRKLTMLKFFFFFLFNGTWSGVIRPGLGRGKVGGAAVRGLERGTSFGEVRAPYLQATPATQLDCLKAVSSHASPGCTVLFFFFFLL
jgi:hypothetical protein